MAERRNPNVVAPSPQNIGKTIRSVTQWIKKKSKKAWDALTTAEQKIEKAKMGKVKGTASYAKTGLLRDQKKKDAYLKEVASWSD
jgi:hypothetical protein